MMRTAVVILLALVAVVSAGVWALGEYGSGFLEPAPTQGDPIVREAEAPAPASPNSDASPGGAVASAPAPARTAAPEPAESAQAPEPEAAADTTESAAAQRANPALSESYDATSDPLTDALRSVAPPQVATSPTPTPAPAPAPDEQRVVQPQSTQPSRTVAAAVAAQPTLADQFKSRTVTYNRPPEKLILDRAIDVSLVINATADEDAGAEALQGFPGTIVEREVELSDTVSAQLTGVGFDIVSQTVERQKLSDRTLNRWQWRVTPTEKGSRVLILEIFGYETGSLDATPLDAYRDEIVVEVEQLGEVIKWAQSVQPIFAVLAALAGALSALFAFLRFRAEKKNRKT